MEQEVKDMKKLVIAPLICILALTFCLTGAAYAQEEEALPDPGITPDSSFYFADKWAKQLALMFTFQAESKVQKALHYADERLAEVDAMLVRNRIREATDANNEYQNCLEIATQYMERARVKGIDTSETVALTTSKHLQFLNDNIADAPEDAYAVLTQTRERARICQETALMTMARGDPEKAIQTNLMLMERQLDRIRVRAEERDTVRLQEELREYERLGNLGEEISQIARQLGKGITVDQLVGQATTYHLQVLAQVHQCVQEQSRQAVEDAIQNCVQNHQRVVTELKAQNQLGQIPEEPTIPDEISEKIKQQTSSGGSGQKR
jgi:hypothetical protein